MRTELLKLRSMPTPFWCGLAVLAFFLIGLAITFVWGVGDDLAATAAIAFPTAICSVVLGVWIFGVEYGQRTMRRTLTADPDRRRLILAKLAAALSAAVGVTVLLYLLALPLYGLANSGHSFSFDPSGLFRQGLYAVFTNSVYLLVGSALAMVTASMAGGMTAALIFIFVLDGMLSLIPKIGDYTFGLAVADLSSRIAGSDTTGFGAGAGHSPVVAALLVFAWVAVLLLLGANRMLRSDVK